MLKNIVHLTLLSYLWKRYKTVIVSTLVLFAYFYLVGLLHQDYVSYSELNNDTRNIGLSFIIKWLLYLVGCMVYLLFVNNKVFASKERSEKQTLTTMDSLKANKNKKRSSEAKNASNEAEQTTDPFDAIRAKKNLRSKADVLIDKH